MIEYLSNNKCIIDYNGNINIIRKGEEQKVFCPKKIGQNTNCGVWCPLFFEVIGRFKTLDEKIVTDKMIILGCSYGPQIAYEIKEDRR